VQHSDWFGGVSIPKRGRRLPIEYRVKTNLTKRYSPKVRNFLKSNHGSVSAFVLHYFTITRVTWPCNFAILSISCTGNLCYSTRISYDSFFFFFMVTVDVFFLLEIFIFKFIFNNKYIKIRIKLIKETKKFSKAFI
jgi:hypothetical protein